MCSLFLFVGWGSTFAQERTVSGRVTSDEGEGLPGVTVLEKNTNNGTATNVNGEYSITVSGNDAVLVFSFIGYTKEEIEVGNRSTIDVALDPDIASLEEVVVIGYGTVKKRDLTGSVASVKSEEIVQTPTFNAMEAIQGRAPGIDIVRSSGEAGAGTDVRIRGNRSIHGSNSPLYIIDGFQGGNINDINPNDIESIEILKDASATAIYGSMGANGVIIVTTKRGREGKAKISYNGFYGVNGLTPFPERRIGEDFMNLRREAWRTAGRWESEADDSRIFSAAEWEAIENDQWVDWVDLLMRNGRQQSHTVSVRGGNENTQVYFSGGFFEEQGMYRLNDFRRYNARLNVDQKLTDWAKVGLLSQITYNDRNRRRDPLSDAIGALPLGTPYTDAGEIIRFPIAGNQDVVSPLADEMPNAAVDNTNGPNVSLNAFLQVEPIEGISWRSNFGSNLNNSRRGEYFDAESYARRNQRTSFARMSASFNRFYHWDNIINLSREFGDHSLTITGITNYTRGINDGIIGEGVNQVLSSQLFYGLPSAEDNRLIHTFYTETETMSYAARIHYGFRGKYLLTLTNRWDGASRLAPGNKWAAFPSVAAAWNLDREAFMDDVDAISMLKLRASYGLTGNSGIDPYGTQSLIYYSPRMGFGDVSAPMYQFTGRVGNLNLGWENSATANLGLDLGFFNNRLEATIDAYDTKTSDILMARLLPWSTGVTDVYQNIGGTRNRGVEISINSLNVDRSNFRWNSTFTFTRNKEEITELVDGTDIIQNERNSLLMGHPINSFYTYNKLGIWQEDEADLAAEYRFGSEDGRHFEPGDIKLEDLNGDGIINADDDRTYVGSTVPKWIAGLRNNIRFGAFDLDLFLFARWGQTIDAEFLGRFDPEGLGGSLATLDYWTPENPTNDYPRPRRGQLNNIPGYQALTFVEGSYFKIRNLSLGYTIPQSLTDRVGIERIRFYATGANLLVLTKSHLLRGYDPEGGGSESYPINRQLVFGINLDF